MRNIWPIHLQRLRAIVVSILSILSLYSYIVLLNCTPTLYSYIVLLYCTPKLYSYIVLLYCTPILYSYIVLLHGTPTFFPYIVFLHSELIRHCRHIFRPEISGIFSSRNLGIIIFIFFSFMSSVTKVFNIQLIINVALSKRSYMSLV